MTSTREENGEKGTNVPVGSGHDLFDRPPDTEVGSFGVEEDARVDLGILSQKPTLVRYIKLMVESLLLQLADNWKSDCARQNARFLWSTMACAFGAAGYYILPDEPQFAVLLTLVVGLIFWILLLATKGNAVFGLVLVAMSLIGVAAASFHGSFRATPVLEKDFSAVIIGRLEQVERRSQNGRKDERWTVKVESIKRLDAEKTPKRLLLVRKSLGEIYSPGERLQMRARLTALQRPAYPGGFEYGRYLWARSIGGQGYLSRSIERLPSEKVEFPFAIFDAVSFAIERTRGDIADYLFERMDGDAAGLAIALSVGKREYLSNDVKTALRQSGLAHILAISGLHMALVVMSVFWALRICLTMVPGLVLRYPIKQWSAAVAFGCGAAYLVLSGSSIATVRAFLMSAIFLIAIMVGRPALTMHNLALALLLLVLIQPYSVVEAGMQMSFAATAALIASYDRLRSLRSDLKESTGASSKALIGSMPVWWRIWCGLRWIGASLVQWIAGIGTTALIAGLAVLPFSIAHFHQVAPLGLLANLGAMPIVTMVVMPLGLLSVVLAPLGLQSVSLAGVELGLDWIISFSQTIASNTDRDLLVLRGVSSIVPFIVLSLAVFTIHRGKIIALALVPFLGAIVVWYNAPKADLWISQKGTMVAYRDRTHAWQVVGSRRMTLDFSAVLRSDGDPRALLRAMKAPNVQADMASGEAVPYSRCDKFACFVEVLSDKDGSATNVSLSIVRHPSAFDEECRSRDIIVTKLPVPGFCTQPQLVVGKEELETGGARFVHFQRSKARRANIGRDQQRPSEGISTNPSPSTLEVVTALPKGLRPWHHGRSNK